MPARISRHRPAEDQRVRDLSGHRRHRGTAIAALPGVPHRAELRPAAQPLVEGAVDGHVQVRRDVPAHADVAGLPGRVEVHQQARGDLDGLRIAAGR